MGSCLHGDPPTPPNPLATAAAQTGTNISTAIANAYLNSTNQVTPTGSLTYTQNADSHTYTDPATGSVYNIPSFTATQALSKPQQDIQTANETSKLNLANLSADQSAQMQQYLGKPFDPTSTAGAAGNPDWFTSLEQPATSFGDAGSQQTSLGPYGQQQTTFGDPNSTPLSSYGGTGNYQLSAGNVGQQQGQLEDTPGAVFGFGDAGNVTRSYGPQDNFSADRQRVEQSLFDRINPQLDRQQEQLRQQLSDQGIRYGSPAYTAAMDNFNRQANDARLAVTAQGGQEQQRLMDEAAQQAGFQNAAQQQAYSQAQGRGQFYNQAAAQALNQAQTRGQFANQATTQQLQNQIAGGTFANQAQAAQASEAAQRAAFSNAGQQAAFAQSQARGEFANTAQAQQFQEQLAAGGFANAAQQQQYAQELSRAGFSNTAIQQRLSQIQAAFTAQNQDRARYLQEAYAQRGQPINEISALLSQSQVQQPNFMTTPAYQIPTTDYAGIVNSAFQQQFQNYQAQNANTNQLIGGGLGLAGNVIRSPLVSDRRAKKNIHRVGTVFAATPQPVEEPEKKQLGIYQYSYKGDPASTKHIGPMAQDVEKIDPAAVGETSRGLKYIDRDRVMGSILRAS